MNDLPIDERVERLEKSVAALHRQVAESRLSSALLEMALLINVSNQIADLPPEKSALFKKMFTDTFPAMCEAKIMCGAHWGGSEKEERELLQYANRISEDFVQRLSLHEANVRQTRARNNPSIPSPGDHAG